MGITRRSLKSGLEGSVWETVPNSICVSMTNQYPCQGYRNRAFEAADEAVKRRQVQAVQIQPGGGRQPRAVLFVLCPVVFHGFLVDDVFLLVIFVGPVALTIVLIAASVVVPKEPGNFLVKVN